MIITRSPLRITLGGGGTDLPSYYSKHEGLLISAAIDKYVYITLHQTFVQELIVKYSEIERVVDVKDLKHPIIREALKLLKVPIQSLEIASMADVHAGTGLGSSGSFTTALLKALHLMQHQAIGPRALAEAACHIELDLLKEPIGKQDQYIAAFGGVTSFRFQRDGAVEVSPITIGPRLLDLQENLLLFFTGQSRSASAVLQDQDQKTKEMDQGMIANLHTTKQLGKESLDALMRGDFHFFAEVMNVHWGHKRRRSIGMTNSKIDEWYEHGMSHGALGGKLIGAGGGGFLMFYTEEQGRLRRAMQEIGLPEIYFRFDYEGTKVIVQ